MKEVRAFTLAGIADTQNPPAHLKALLAWPTIASKNWVYRQYDHMVRDGSVVCPGSDAAVLRIKTDSLPELPTANPRPEKLIAMSVDGNGAYVYLDPYEGGKIVVAEACRNLACSGAVPLGMTDNLNCASPHKPELFWQIEESRARPGRGLPGFQRARHRRQLLALQPKSDGPIDPTPTVAMVGLIEKPEHITTQWFKDEGDAIILLGEAVDQADPILGLGGSAYLQAIHGKKTGSPPRCDFETAKTLHTTLIGLIQSGLVKSAHDCSEGGMAVALAESCISQLIARETPRLIGATIDLSSVGRASSRADEQAENGSSVASPHRLDALLFGETQSRVVISCKSLDAVKVVERAKLMGVPSDSNRQSRRRQAHGENRQRRIFRPAHRTARCVVEFHRARNGMRLKATVVCSPISMIRLFFRSGRYQAIWFLKYPECHRRACLAELVLLHQ